MDIEKNVYQELFFVLIMQPKERSVSVSIKLYSMSVVNGKQKKKIKEPEKVHNAMHDKNGKTN